MPYPIRTERDVGTINWTTGAVAFSTARLSTNVNMYMLSDGIVYTDHVQYNVNADVTLVASEAAIGGINITGPLEDVDDYTMYAYQCSAWSEDSEIALALVCGVAEAAPDTDAAAILADTRYLHMGHRSSSDMNMLDVEGVVGLASPFADLGAGFENRAVGFGIAAMCGLNAATAGSRIHGRLSVRRLVGSGPSIYDKFKLG